MDAICVGELLIDFTPGSAPNLYCCNPGGAPANVAVAMARMGINVGFIGKVGKDIFGDYLLETLRAEGVLLLCPHCAEEAVTTMVFVSLMENGERTFTFVRKPGADMLLNKEDILDKDIQKTKLLHAGSVSMSDEPARGATLYAMQRARELGKIVSFDVNYRDMIWNGNRDEALRCIRQALSHTDLLKISEEEAGFLLGNREPSALLETYAIHAVVVTHGEKGAHCYMRGGDCQASTTAKQAIDTTGAGDAFWGNTLAYLLRSGVKHAGEINLQHMEAAMRWGNAAGGFCVERKGAIPAMPMFEQLAALL